MSVIAVELRVGVLDATNAEQAKEWSRTATETDRETLGVGHVPTVRLAGPPPLDFEARRDRCRTSRLLIRWVSGGTETIEEERSR